MSWKLISSWSKYHFLHASTVPSLCRHSAMRFRKVCSFRPGHRLIPNPRHFCLNDVSPMRSCFAASCLLVAKYPASVIYTQTHTYIHLKIHTL